MDKLRAGRWMTDHAREYVDPLTKEVDVSGLAKGCSAAIFADRPTDTGGDWIWEMALVVANDYLTREDRR